MSGSIATQQPFPALSSVSASPRALTLQKPSTSTGPRHATEAWNLVNSLGQSLTTDQRGHDHDFWWRTTGVTLAILLEQAQYPYEDQCRHLALYYTAVIPELGAGPDSRGRPAAWRSFMTDHHCPLEFSWEWNRHSELPTIRYSFEPIGQFAGTSADRLNKYAALRFVEQHGSKIEGCDLLWFRHLWDGLISFTDPLDSGAGRRWSVSRVRNFWEIFSNSSLYSKEGKPSSVGHESRCFLALDLNESSLTLKTYYMPGFKAQDTGKSVMTTIYNAIESLPALPENFWTPYNSLKRFMNENPLAQSLIPEIVATDCVSPEKSRIKIYVRSPLTSLKSVLDMLCLGGAPEQHISQTGLQQFEKLWKMIWGDGNDDRAADEELSTKSHRTGGTLYYFEIRPGQKAPAVKVYLPLRHYGSGDDETSAALQKFLRSTSRKDHSSKYVEALRKITSSSVVRDSNTTQTYLTCMIMGDELRITSYLAPVVYRSDKRA